jgi:transcriptional regulator with PAS, ATPase and Fis domain
MAIPIYIKPQVIKSEVKIPDESKLRLLASNPETIGLANEFINRYKLPYTVELDQDGLGVLKNTLSPGELHLKRFITVDPETEQMKLDAIKIAKTPYEVLIVGDTGTGKEIIAKSMIYNRKGEIKAINCAGIPETLIEAELFGYKRGAFTGADRDKDGLMTSAKDGVMFFDEIGEMPIQMQAKLLRAIQEKRIFKVGSTNEEDINCKMVFATHRDLLEMVEKGTFRKDLYARIATLILTIKPLKDRMCDIEPICQSIHRGKEFYEAHVTELNNGTLDVNLNVRSLQQYITRFDVLGKAK